MDMFLFIQKMNQQRNDITMCLKTHNKGNTMSKPQIQVIVDDLQKQEPLVAVHCKAGKGRTGLIICCFMLFTRLFDSVEDSLRHYDKTRTHNGRALTI